MQATVDRMENGIAVLILHDGSCTRVMLPSVLLPEGCREGDIVTLTLERNPAGTQKGRDVVAGQIGRLNTITDPSQNQSLR